MYIISSCLAGFNCRYDGSNKENKKIINLVKEGKAIPICPEQLAGLTTPRKPSEIVNNKVLTIDGEDVTESFIKAAKETIYICKKYKCDKAILKQGSPSCGCGKIYDGSFSGKLIDGDGITTKALKEAGIKVISEKDL